MKYFCTVLSLCLFFFNFYSGETKAPSLVSIRICEVYLSSSDTRAKIQVKSTNALFGAVQRPTQHILEAEMLRYDVFT